MKKFFLLFISITLFSCDEHFKQENFNETVLEYEEFILKAIDDIPTSILSSKEYVLLENNNIDCFTNLISKVVFSKNRIYILDPTLYKIVVFDKQGKGIGTVGRRGEGPEEYLSISDFALDKNGDIYFIDGVLDKLFIFDSDLKFKEKRNLPFEADILHILDNGNILWGLCSWNEKACKGMKIARTDSQLNIIDSAIEYDDYCDHGYMISWYKFIETDKHLVYNHPIDNHIYLFDKEGNWVETICVDFGDMNVPDEHRKNIEVNLDSFKQYCLLQHYSVVTDRIVAGALKKRQKTVPFIYDKATNICYEGVSSEKLAYTLATGYNSSKWITYLEDIDETSVLPDSVVNHINNEGMVLCLQDLK